MKKFIISTLITLTMLGGACVGCNKNISSRPELAPLVGKSVELREAYFIVPTTTNYYLSPVGPNDDSHSRSVGELGVGSRIKILRFEEQAQGLLISLGPGRVKAILEIMIPSQSNKVVIAELLVKEGEGSNYEFPW